MAELSQRNAQTDVGTDETPSSPRSFPTRRSLRGDDSGSTPGRKQWWKRTGPLLTGLGSLIGLAVGIISILPIIFNNSSSLNTLSLSASPYRSDEVRHYVLPLNAPIEQFPPSEVSCSEEQSVWLDAHGERFQRDYLIEVRNTAENGSFIALQNFHGVGRLSSGSEGVVVECDMTSATAVAEPAHLQMDTTTGAYFDKSDFGDAGQGAPNTPLAYNLEPGETGQIVLSLSSLKDFEGSLQVSAAVGKEIKNVSLTSSGAPLTIAFPGSSLSRTIAIKVEGDRLVCEPLPASPEGDCDVHRLFTE